MLFLLAALADIQHIIIILYITPFQIKAALPVQAATAVAQSSIFFIGQHSAFFPPFYFEQSLFLIQPAHLFFQIGLILHSGFNGSCQGRGNVCQRHGRGTRSFAFQLADCIRHMHKARPYMGITLHGMQHGIHDRIADVSTCRVRQ